MPGGSRISASAVQHRLYRPARVPITGVTEGAGVGRDLGLDGVVDHFTLSGDEAGWLRNKSGSTRLGFAVQLKFLTWRGRFPKTRLELPPPRRGRARRQAGRGRGLGAGVLRLHRPHRPAAPHELRKPTGWHECSKIDGRQRRGGADVADGLADHCPHRGLIESLEAAVGKRGESVGDIKLRDVAAAAGDGDQGALGQAVVERGRGGRVAVSRARCLGAGGDGAVDRGQGAGDVEESVRLRAAVAELRLAVRLPRGFPVKSCVLRSGSVSQRGEDRAAARSALVSRAARGPRSGARCWLRSFSRTALWPGGVGGGFVRWAMLQTCLPGRRCATHGLVTRCSSERRTGQCGPAVRSRILRCRAGSAPVVLITGSTHQPRQENSCPPRCCRFPPRTARPMLSPPSPTTASSTQGC
ncbi:DUF4158 domain-containing protein [Streptomyces sp. NPDC020800]|uniref:DUF4158 domain-containing protein n=1 Tax=Streptomyces sp. NPDC020800 TaxID=3365092 RepID=UPI0037B95F2F